MSLVLLAGVMGCRARKPTVAESAPIAAPAPSAKASAQRPAPPAPPVIAPPELPWFPPLDWSERRPPEDFRIGVLQRAGIDAAAYTRLETVCEGLVHGRVETSALDPSRAEGLSEALSGQMERGGRPTEYRIGRLEPISDAAVWARVRFFGKGGSVEGEAYLERQADAWFVTDLQFDLSMVRPTAERRAPFVPSPYRGKTD